MNIGEKIDQIVEELERHKPLAEFMACQILKAVCGVPQTGTYQIVRIGEKPASQWYAEKHQLTLAEAKQ